jgi:L-cysteine:1D-myo-inositol 2-amino-2-deoxy-alpha-D-glucopyranoside ligase
MTLQLFNAIKDEIEDFEPVSYPITVYVCGITPYDTTHLGHAFTYTAFDILIRYLEFQGHPVEYAQNVTDIDDDILRRAHKVGEDWRRLGSRWTRHFIDDMEALNVRPPDHFPRATEFIPEIVETVEDLLAAGVAYEAGGSVYFHIDAWPEYGRLSCLPRDQMLSVANERGNIPNDPNKRDPLDFVLWQAQVPGEPGWESPWGMGRPGWHIECSTMSSRLLGGTVDIHGGGADLVFPHHESEIAQSENATNHKPFVRFWMHTAMVRHEGEKMSKSLGNLVMIRDLLETWTPDTLRLYMGSHHYRKAWEHSEAELAAAKELSDRLKRAVIVPGGAGEELASESYRATFNRVMDADLDTPQALPTLAAFADDILEAAAAGRNVEMAQQNLRQLGAILGLRLDAEGPEKRVSRGWQQHKQRFLEE